MRVHVVTLSVSIKHFLVHFSYRSTLYILKVVFFDCNVCIACTRIPYFLLPLTNIRAYEKCRGKDEHDTAISPGLYLAGLNCSQVSALWFLPEVWGGEVISRVYETKLTIQNSLILSLQSICRTILRLIFLYILINSWLWNYVSYLLRIMNF